jgi:SAM-dependent methyltransferase
MIATLKRRARRLVPLPARMRLAAWLTRQRWLPVQDHVAMGIIRDLQTTDPKEFHKFVWSNHLMGYARWYDSEEELFAPEQMQPSRVELFGDLIFVLEHDLGLPSSSVSSVLEVGCSQGYLLRHLETDVFPACPDLVGLDIDAPAIEKGKHYLQKVGSRVRLLHGDMENLDGLLDAGDFDVTLAAGVLSYLNEQDATVVVSRMLRRTRRVLALAGLAWVDGHNRTLDQSIPSPSHEGQWIHNFESMIAAAGGRVVRSRWEGARLYNLQTLCFAFAVPGESRP